MTNLEKIQHYGKDANSRKLSTSQCEMYLTLLAINRDINPAHKARLKKWLIEVAKNNQFGSIPPLLVVATKEGEVVLIDGYHRLSAGLALLHEESLEIEFTISYMEVESIPDALRVFNNTQLSWKTQDFIKHNVAIGKEDYVTLDGFISHANNLIMTQKGFGVQSALELIMGDFKPTSFRDGELEISGEAMEVGMRNLNELYQVQEALMKIGMSAKAAKVVSRGACKAFYKIHSNSNFVSIENFIGKLLAHPLYISDNTDCKAMLTAYEIILKA